MSKNITRVLSKLWGWDYILATNLLDTFHLHFARLEFTIPIIFLRSHGVIVILASHHPPRVLLLGLPPSALAGCVIVSSSSRKLSPSLKQKKGARKMKKNEGIEEEKSGVFNEE
ncbi:unnamed protein product [Dovyalis caffra]|uniref:Uncharacterized protein n=1 Tax=Dovyalis caffra TaxID=77055 RepID=A0AAV1RNA1_9ROSI|nr:unnamed protein product [Dovyalis caffra]